ncbi:hypothetical protein Leryth_002194 [Lithospermum erythrorhizon]|nr:hypothetical protein Leryth_002194 [Lithospermum erythrorhizon]
MENSCGSYTNGSVRKEWRAEEVVAGNVEALQALRELIVYPIRYSRQSQKLGLNWPQGLLLYGPPGTGKTSLVRAVVRECGAHLIVISPHTVLRSYVGESEEVMRDAFAEALSHAKSGKPSVIFIDEIDSLCPRRDSRRAQDTRIASQLFMLMDSNRSMSSAASHVVVVASTNRVDAIDPALRRSGRFDAEVEVTTPSEEERFQILKLYTKKLPLDATVDLSAIASSCNGYVGADIEALCREATFSAARSSESSSIHCLNMDDWEHAKSVVGPSITRGVTVEVPKITWEDIGGLKDLKKKLQQAVEWPLKHSTVFSRLGVSPIRGVLLHGPPGCSKTTLAKAAAHAAQASFFSLSGADLYSMYVGEGEALVRNIFRRARLAAPSIIFFDEADVLYVPPPDQEARYEILQVHTRRMQMSDDVNLRQIAEDTELFTGAELEGMCREAGMVALREDISATVVSNRHFQIVLQELKPALSREDIESYSSFMKNPSSISLGKFEVSSQERTKETKNARVLTTLAIVGVSVVLSACLKYGRTITDHFSRDLHIL